MTRETVDLLLDASGYVAPASYLWTRDVSSEPLRFDAVATLVSGIEADLETAGILFPDAEDLVRRCVVALLCGHLVLQGPPGTGKTTLARLLAKSFSADLAVTTATADWSTYDVIGGLRPGRDGTLQPGLGCVSQAALDCAVLVRDDMAATSDTSTQARWLLLDELNRADIDKAVGPLYTVLSSVTAQHLAETPLELWFESDEGRRLWLPSRFRVIGTMNDVDTSFVNALSQGLARRFQFVYLGVPGADDTAAEVERTLRQAHRWLANEYGSRIGLEPVDDAVVRLLPQRAGLVALLDAIRRPSGDVLGWPLGSAQVVDVWKTVLLQTPDVATGNPGLLLDEAVADRVVPQMSTLDRSQLDEIRRVLEASQPPFVAAAEAVGHLVNPYSPL